MTSICIYCGLPLDFDGCGCPFEFDGSFYFCNSLCEFEFILLLKSDIPF